jgi:hypothetical protein
MIVFDLACTHGHRFEGWFASADDYARQNDAGLVRCPACDDVDITRVPSARVRTGHAAAPPVATHAPENETPAAPANAAPVATGLPAELVERLREIVRNTENVGARFPEEARRIHYDEAPARAIRGQASREEADALRDEGIDFSSLPPFLTRDTH